MGSAHHREFCPHEGVVDEPPSPTTLAGRVSGDARARLGKAGFLALALTGLTVIGAAFREGLDPIAWALAATVALASFGLIAAVAPKRPVTSLARAGTPYLLGISVALAFLEQRASMAGGVSASALWVAFFPVMVPCSPRVTLAKALAAASATPLALLVVGALEGRGLPAWSTVAEVTVPVLVAAVMAHAGASAMARVGAALSRAQKVGRYELTRRLGAGGMGEVWEARHPMLARPVAVKVVRGDADATTRTRFEREAQVTASLESPHTVRLHDFGVTEAGQLYYVMERLEGMDLEHLVAAHGPMPPARVVPLLRQALRSLGEAHARGLVHRDVKPANLHLGRRGLDPDHLTVLDFGLVKPSPGTSLGPTLTGDDRISGTPAYLAPETVTGGRAIDGRADVYALGLVAHWMLTGRRVFEGDSVLQVAVAHVTEAPTPLRVLDPSIPAELEALVLACLAKSPDDRPDAEELTRRLDALALDDAWTREDAERWWASLPPTAPASRPHPSAATERAPVPMRLADGAPLDASLMRA